jgi:hypothetical protein
VVVYQFERAQVDNLDFGDFLSVYPPDRLPQGSKLRAYCNSFVFVVGGYDNDSRELYVVPEVRDFYRRFYEVWPYWWFCCNLDTPNLMLMTMACLNIQIIENDACPGSNVCYSRSELRDFIWKGMPATHQLVLRAGMSDSDFQRRCAEVLRYFSKDWNSWPPIP